MKFAIFSPSANGYWIDDAMFTSEKNWKKAKLFLTREDAEAYLRWIQKQGGGFTYSCSKDYIVRQVE